MSAPIAKELEGVMPILPVAKAAKTLAPVALGALVGLDRVHWGALVVGAVVMTLPVLAAFVFLQRCFVAGTTAGAVK